MSTDTGEHSVATGTPPPISRWIAISSTTLAVLPLASPTRIPIVLGALGALLLALGVMGGSRRGIDWGMSLQVAGIVVGGLEGISPELLLAATFGTLLAREIGRYGLVLDSQLGKRAETDRVELVHAGSYILVGGGGIIASYGVYAMVDEPLGVGTVVLFGIAAFSLAAALR